MSLDKIMEFVVNIENKYPVADWTVDDLHVWPLIRVNTVYSFIVNTTVGAAGTSGIKNTPSDTEGYKRQSPNRDENPLEHRADAVFLSLTDTARVKLDNVLHDSLCDYLMHLLGNMGISSLFMGLSLKYDLECATNSQIIDIRRYLYSIMSNAGPAASNKYHLGGLDAFNKELISFLEINNTGIPIYDIEALKRKAAEIRNIAGFFDLVFNRIKPALGFVTCYYDPVGMAFNLACKENGIVSFDLQHGHLTDNHFAYAAWNNVPVQGYELLPDYFWCWGKKEAEVINKWSSSEHTFHKPIIGGNPWHEYMKNYTTNDFAEKTEKLRSICSGKINILFTHQASYGIEDWIIEAIENSPDSWFWWIRLHPRTDETEKSMVIDKLNRCRNRNIEVNISTELPLPILLNSMNVHITGFSSCVIEALLHDVLSVVTNYCGIDHYSGEIEEGIVLTAFNKEDLINAIMLQYSRRKGKGNVKEENSKFLNMAVDKVAGMARRSSNDNMKGDFYEWVKKHQENTDTLFSYLKIVHANKMYRSIISNYWDNDAIPALYFVFKAYNSMGNENKAYKYLNKLIQKLEYINSNTEIHSTEVYLWDLYSGVAEIVINGTFNEEQYKMDEIINRLSLKNGVFRETYLNKLFQGGYYNRVIEYKGYNQPDTNYFIGRACKSLFMYEDSKAYLHKYISAFENNCIGRMFIVSDKNYAVSAYFHLGEMYYIQDAVSEAYDCFVKCNALSETLHVKANEYMKKIRSMSGNIEIQAGSSNQC